MALALDLLAAPGIARRSGADSSIDSSPRSAPSPPPLKDLLRFEPAADLRDDPAALLPADAPLIASDPPVYALSAAILAVALDRRAHEPLPSPGHVFPWLHGLNPSNAYQLAFLDPSGVHAHPYTPSRFRNITLVKLGSLGAARLVGTVSHHEFLPDPPTQGFLSLDPPHGVGLRNFHIQVAKTATLSDIVVYSKRGLPTDGLVALAKRISAAQIHHRSLVPTAPVCRTFIVSDPFEVFERLYPHLVAVSSSGRTYEHARDFLTLERLEMNSMSAASEVTPNFYLGNAHDTQLEIDDGDLFDNLDDLDDDDDERMSDASVSRWDIYVECMAAATIPSPLLLQSIDKEYFEPAPSGFCISINSNRSKPADSADAAFTSSSAPASSSVLSSVSSSGSASASSSSSSTAAGASTTLTSTATAVAHIEFPSSGSLALGNLTDRDIEAIVDFCEWLYRHAAVENHRVLLYCVDGYTETSLLGLAYLMYSTGCTAPQTYIDLHKKYNRAFFTFPADLVLLNHLQTRLLLRSPVANPIQNGVMPDLPEWFVTMDGSLPSKIFPHMYLGNLGHANNYGLLRELGIKRVLSVGESIDWCTIEGDEECNDADSAMSDEPSSSTKPTLRRKSAPGAMEDDAHSSQTSLGDNTSPSSTDITHSLDDSAIVSGEQVPVPGFTKLMYVDQIQDDGIDSLSKSIESCLAFLDDGFRAGEPTLVHCRVGVSRSATICIAEAMRRRRMSLPRAYLFVRARRLNVIIQPNLRFMYELMKWEEEEEAARLGGTGRHRREMEWPVLCREIAAMNKAYIG
ncbi:hypothetical protein BZA70DRAFT_173429 [Myxozyma melibiosi]|uniref:Protein-tyrosine-phosphatase n=1 Tax=Myxozyma melibiosi TaxID=54550 RepID=A0ABR1F5I3_9ASCO